MEELADLLADGDPFDLEPDQDGFAVGYDDVIAHEHADLVASSVAALEAVAGVREVVHEDRELLLVRTSGDVTRAQLEAALRAFWRAAAARPTVTQVSLKAMATAAAAPLKREGFRKKGLRWNREPAPGFVQVIELGRAEEGDGSIGTVHVGLYDEETAHRRGLGTRGAFVSEADGQVRYPAGTFMLSSDPTSLLALLEDQVVPLLRRVRSRPDVLAEQWQGSLFNPIDRAIMLALEGDDTAAHGLLQDCFDRLRHARRHLHAVTGACGLPPLTTGASPERTTAEEALGAAWSAGEAEAVSHLRRTFADTGHDPRLLDGSTTSLDPLHGAWRQLVAIAQADARPTSSPLMALPTGAWSRYDTAPPADPEPTPAARRLTEGLACYLAELLRRRVPGVRWEVVETGAGFEPVVAGLPIGPVRVVNASIDLLDAALRPSTEEQERLFRRYNPLRADVERWLQEAPPPPARPGRGVLGRFRRG